VKGFLKTLKLPKFSRLLQTIEESSTIYQKWLPIVKGYSPVGLKNISLACVDKRTLHGLSLIMLIYEGVLVWCVRAAWQNDVLKLAVNKLEAAILVLFEEERLSLACKSCV